MTSQRSRSEDESSPEELFFDRQLMQQVLRPYLQAGRITTQEIEVLQYTHEPHFVHAVYRLLGKKKGRISRRRALEVLINLSDHQGLQDYIRQHKVPRKSLRHQMQICLAQGYREDVDFLRPFYPWPLHHQLEEAVYCDQLAMIELALSDYSYPGTRRSRKALGNALEMAIEFERPQAIAIVAPLCVREGLRVPSRECLRNYFWSKTNSDDPLIQLLNYPLPGLVPRLLKSAFRRSRWRLWYKICDTQILLGKVDQKLLQYFLRAIIGSRSNSLERLEALTSLMEALRAPETFPNLTGPAEAFRQLKNYNIHGASLEMCLYFHNRLKASKNLDIQKDAPSTVGSSSSGRFDLHRRSSSP